MNRVNEIKQAIDRWAKDNGHNIIDQAHRELAEAVYDAVKHRYRPPASSKGLLLDVDEAGDYCNARLVEWEGAEEALYPIDPETDEPVEEAVAHYAVPLPHPDSIPEI